jgi:large subunit ribosomal protein L24
MHVKKGDTVLVISGNDKGRTGLVKEALPSKERVIVEGVNLRWRHKRPSQQNPKGERTQIEMAIHASNVRRVEEAGGKKAAKTAAKKAAKKVAKGVAKGVEGREGTPAARKGGTKAAPAAAAKPARKTESASESAPRSTAREE